MLASDAVQITINVVDGNSGAVVNQVAKNLDSLGTAGTRAGSQVRAGMQQAGEGARASAEKIRLPLEEMGIRLPRAFVGLIAQSKLAQQAIGAVGGALMGIGAIQIGGLIFEQLYESAKKLWDEHLSLTKAASDYYDEVEKTQEQKFGDSTSIETTRARIDEATEAVKNFHQQAQAASDTFNSSGWRNFASLAVPGAGAVWQTLHQRSEGADEEKQAFALQRQVDKLNQEKENEQYHQGRSRDIEEGHAADAELRGFQKINAEKQKSIELNAEERRYNNERDRIADIPVAPDATAAEKEKARVMGLPLPMNAGESEEAAKNRIAERQADAETANLQREQMQELMHLREAAIEAALRGSALYRAQETAAIEDLKFKDMDSAAARNAIHLKFHNEEMMRLRDESNEISKARVDAAGANLTGIAKIQNEGATRVNDIYATADKRSPGGTLALVKAANDRTHGEMVQAEQEFTLHVNELADESAAHQIGGFGRIRAEAQKQIDDLTREFQKLYGTNINAPEYRAHVGELNRGVGAINAGAGGESADLARRNGEETEQIESEARAKFLSAERQQTAAIGEEYRQRIEKYAEQLKDQEILQSDYDRRVAAAAEMRDAEMVDAARQAREKMAGEFTSLFRSLDHPAEAFKELGAKAAGQAAAAMVQRVQTRVGGGIGAPGAPAGAMTEHLGLPNIFDRIAGVPRGTLAAVPAAPGAVEHSGMASATAASSKMISLASAEIRIGSANISMTGIPPSNQTAAAGAGPISAPAMFSGGSGISAGSTNAGASIPGAPMTGASTSLMSIGGYRGSGSTAAVGGASSTTQAIRVGSAPAAFSSAGSTPLGGFVPSGGASGFGSPVAMGAAGDTGWTGTAPAGAASGATGPLVSPTAAKANGVMGELSQGAGLFKQAQSIFGQKSGSAATGGAGSLVVGSDTDQIPLQSMKNFDVNQMAKNPGEAGMLGGGGFMSNVGGAATGALGLYGAIESNGGVGGALSGAMSGMQLGMSVGGPLGAAIGAAGGAVLGAIGFGGKEKARVYYLKTVLPRITADVDGMQQGTMDYTSAYSDLQSADAEAHKTLDKMGPAGHSYYWDTVIGKIHQAEGKLTAEQRAGRSQFTTSAAQYAAGTDFVPQTGQYRLHRGESVLTAEETEQRSGAIDNGAAPTRMAAESQASWGGDVHIHTIDAKSAHRWIMDNKHTFRAAVNASFAENSGGADA